MDKEFQERIGIEFFDLGVLILLNIPLKKINTKKNKAGEHFAHYRQRYYEDIIDAFVVAENMGVAEARTLRGLTRARYITEQFSSDSLEQAIVELDGADSEIYFCLGLAGANVDLSGDDQIPYDQGYHLAAVEKTKDLSWLEEYLDITGYSPMLTLSEHAARLGELLLKKCTLNGTKDDEVYNQLARFTLGIAIAQEGSANQYINRGVAHVKCAYLTRNNNYLDLATHDFEQAMKVAGTKTVFYTDIFPRIKKLLE